MCENKGRQVDDEQFAEIEVTPESILIRRAATNALITELHGLLLAIANDLENARSPWDGESVDAESIFMSVASRVAQAIKAAVKCANQRSDRKKIPSGR